MPVSNLSDFHNNPTFLILFNTLLELPMKVQNYHCSPVTGSVFNKKKKKTKNKKQKNNKKKLITDTVNRFSSLASQAISRSTGAKTQAGDFR